MQMPLWALLGAEPHVSLQIRHRDDANGEARLALGSWGFVNPTERGQSAATRARDGIIIATTKKSLARGCGNLWNAREN